MIKQLNSPGGGEATSSIFSDHSAHYNDKACVCYNFSRDSIDHVMEGSKKFSRNSRNVLCFIFYETISTLTVSSFLQWRYNYSLWKQFQKNYNPVDLFKHVKFTLCRSRNQKINATKKCNKKARTRPGFSNKVKMSQLLANRTFTAFKPFFPSFSSKVTTSFSRSVSTRRPEMCTK